MPPQDTTQCSQNSCIPSVSLHDTAKPPWHRGGEQGPAVGHVTVPWHIPAPSTVPGCQHSLEAAAVPPARLGVGAPSQGERGMHNSRRNSTWLLPGTCTWQLCRRGAASPTSRPRSWMVGGQSRSRHAFARKRRKPIAYFCFLIQPGEHQEDQTALVLQEKALMDLGGKKNPSPYKGCEHFPT